jgi:hypothetical protein
MVPHPRRRPHSISRPRIDRASRPLRRQGRDGIPSGLMEPSSPLHPLQPYRPSNRTDRRAVNGRCMPVPRWPTLSVWTWPVDDFHRIAQGHHRDASCPAFANCTRSSAIAQRAKRTTIPLRRLHGVFKARRYLAISPRFGYCGHGYEKRQPESHESSANRRYWRPREWR